ncbi:8-oxoguanine deaminase [candidate division KSB3 bacterium]|uniref:8-oxoguanine deaminase n=1 Tax=candidate division KSB3 bacterium TaxID=2044937 RepID=A0A2G6EAL9_9BACT|nr:MAG: 8-oxoguanine deaminase [candidate division KSB3 bacterium]PIE30723.1 MAG: 8-oxoguanine deaminase [candidate division KSB3 bacterium]
MLLLKNCFYISPSPEQEGLRDHDILIDGCTIKKIAQDISLPTVDQTTRIDASTCVVIPGLVNTHHHFYQTLTRNLPAVQNAELFEWLSYLYDVWKHLDEDAIYYSSLLAMAELLKTGCTTSTDHHYIYPEQISADIMGIQCEAAEHLGMRFSPTRGSMSLSRKDGGLPPDSVVQSEDEILKDSERVIQRYHDDSEFSMRKIMLAPCSPFSVTEQLMKDTVELARTYGVRLHTHLAETRDETAFCEQHYGRRPLTLMEDCDFIGEDVSYAHGIHFNADELQHLAETKTHIAHCPSSNMRLGSGICQVREMLEYGINVALAVDGSASNDASDMLGEARTALMLQRVTKGANAITARDVFRIASENGAKLLNFRKLGRLEEGWAADIALFDLHKLEYCGSFSDPLAALIFSGYNHGTEYTIVNGKIVVEHGQLVGFDEEKLIQKAQSSSQNILHS